MLTLLHISDLHFGPPFAAGGRRGPVALGGRAAGPTSSWPAAISRSGPRPRNLPRPGRFSIGCRRCRWWSCPAITTCRCIGRLERLFAPYALYRRYISDGAGYRAAARRCRDRGAQHDLAAAGDHQRPDRALATRFLRRGLSRRAAGRGRDRRGPSSLRAGARLRQRARRDAARQDGARSVHASWRST